MILRRLQSLALCDTRRVGCTMLSIWILAQLVSSHSYRRREVTTSVVEHQRNLQRDVIVYMTPFMIWVTRLWKILPAYQNRESETISPMLAPLRHRISEGLRVDCAFRFGAKIQNDGYVSAGPQNHRQCLVVDS